MTRLKTKITYSQPEQPFWTQKLIQLIEFSTGRKILERKFNALLEEDPEPILLWEKMIKGLGIDVIFDQEKLEKIPKEGPLIIIANHPFGVVDGLALGYLGSLIRDKFKFLVNAVLCKEEKLNEFFLPVSFEDSKEAQQMNIKTKNQAIERLMNGEAILIFPAGGVATSKKLWTKAEDLEWKKFVIKLVKISRATVVPVFFPGQNSRLFQIVSQFSLHLRLSLLLREVRNKQNSRLEMKIGDPIPFEEYEIGSKLQDPLLFLQKKVKELEHQV